MRLLLVLVLQAVVIAAAGCGKLEISTLEHGTTTTPALEDRQDCDQILGTAFRSAEERTWFTENCSAWADATLGRVEGGTQTSDGQQGAPREGGGDGVRRDEGDRAERDGGEREGDAGRCNEMRGRPYESPEARQWYLQNCLNQPSNDDGDGNRDERDGDGNSQNTAWNCNDLRGRPYESPQQRDWYLANCNNPGPANANNPGTANPGTQGGGGVGPNGRGCNEIYGTRFRSMTERNWFTQNCPH